LNLLFGAPVANIGSPFVKTELKQKDFQGKTVEEKIQSF